MRSGRAALAASLAWVAATWWLLGNGALDVVVQDNTDPFPWVMFYVVMEVVVASVLIIVGGRTLGRSATIPIDWVRVGVGFGVVASGWPIAAALLSREVDWLKIARFPHELVPTLAAAGVLAGAWRRPVSSRLGWLTAGLGVLLFVTGWDVYRPLWKDSQLQIPMPWEHLAVACVVVLVGVASATRWGGAGRRDRAITTTLGILLGGVVVAGAISLYLQREANVPYDTGGWVAMQFVLGVLPVVLAWISLASRSGFSPDAESRELLLALRRVHDVEEAQDALSRAFGDDGLRIGFGSAEDGSIYGVDGSVIGRVDDPAVMVVDTSDRNAYVVPGHARGLAPERAAVMLSALALAFDNAELQQERVRVDEVRRSRRRVVEASDAARRQVERDLHDGAQQRLATLAMRVRMLSSRSEDPDRGADLSAVADELSAAIGELRDLARGIHPASLSDGGLRAAVESLAETAAIPVRFDVTPERFSLAVESTAYFVISEGLANATKHAGARRVDVEAVADGPWLRVTVTDDGCGGADPNGDGLRGLRERVTALDGSLHVGDADGGGTRLEASILAEEA